MENAECSGMMAVAAVVGYNMGVAEGLQTSGTITVSGYNCIGGVLGGNADGTVSGCTAAGVSVTVLGENDYPDGRYILQDQNQCGGLVIGGSFGGTIVDCSGTGTVTALGHDAMGLGGVAGCLENMSSITDCTADVTIQAGENAHGIGGLCGFAGTFDAAAPAQVTGCSVSADIQCAGGATHVGGLIGTGLSMGGVESVFQVTNCTVTAAINGAEAPGAVAGRAAGSEILSCSASVDADSGRVTAQVGQTVVAFESAE